MASSAPKPAYGEFRGRVWQFGECSFDELRYELRVGDRVAELEAKPLEVLHQLLMQAGDVVRKEDLLDSVWPGTLVVDASLANAVSKLRKVLGEDEAIIKTVPKIGYRLGVPVRCGFSKQSTLLAVPETQPSSLVVPRANVPASKARGVEIVFRRHLIGWTVAAVLLAGLAAGLILLRRVYKPNQDLGPVAILPFQNASSTASLDYLRSALPDQVATTLSAARSLPIRPFVATSKYSEPHLDLRKVGRELNVSRVVTGHYVVAGEQLQITMEAVDTQENRVLWHDTVNVAANDLLALQAQVAAMSRGKLAGALGITDFVTETAQPPANKEAYELYLRSIALDWDPLPNKQGIELLRRAVVLDPSYAPAWGSLSLRYYTASRFAGGGPAMLQLSDAAAERQLTLDPDSPNPVAELTIHRTERGELVKAHQQALELLRRRPDNANNHHVLSYVLRYGGSLGEAGHECDAVVLLASKIVWGSCSTTFMELGNYQRAKDFIRKDLSSEWSKAHALEVLLREGKIEEALRISAPQIPHWDSYKMLLACARHEPEAQIKTLAAGAEIDDDPEVNYFFAGHLAYCGQTSESLRLLKLAINGNYCSYPAMDLDPFFDKIRSAPGFAEVRAAGMVCHENFVANREQDHKTVTSQR
ncbi:MAG TPA: winged helix-turn-helix domain-containing protein [Candidatus Acidoferrum sp.]|nr:winged helix-turn-helix domain-containing protein [Candidatus Acidoferrum sp.]